MVARRIFHFTFYKCGSQWVRDLLSDPAIVAHSHCPLVANGVDIPSQPWPIWVGPGLASPLYTASYVDWLERPNPDPEDRCFLVTRDPRDLVVSLVISLRQSHTPNQETALLRTPFRNASPDDQIRLGCHLFSHWAIQLQSWCTPDRDPNILRIDYDDLIADGQAAFGRIFSYLGWAIPDDIATAVIHSHSFAMTSGGRRPGDENQFSHRRKGISGDWRNHFNRQTGELFETVFPGLLQLAGYEKHSNWWQTLPATTQASPSSAEQQMAQLLAVLETQAKEITVQREAAEDRLQDLQKMHRLHQETVDSHQADLVRLTALEGTVALYEQQLAEMESLRIDHANRLATIEKADSLLHQQQAELDLLRPDRETLLRLLAEADARYHQQAAELDLFRTACADRLALIEKSDALLHQQQAELEQLRAIPSPLHQEPPPPATELNPNQRQRGQSA